MASPLYLWAETKLDRRNGIIKRERAYHMLYTISILYIFWMSYVQLISVLCPGRGGGEGGNCTGFYFDNFSQFFTHKLTCEQ